MTAKSDLGNRTQPASAFYRLLMQVIEERRLVLGLSMATVNEISGVAEGYYAKMIYPDTPSGRQARWEQVQDVIEALFGRGFRIDVIPDEDENRRLRSAPRIDANAAGNTGKVRHWRDRKHFERLGRLGGLARAKLPKRKLTAAARKTNAKRWKQARAAKRQGEAHKQVNAEKAARKESSSPRHGTA